MWFTAGGNTSPLSHSISGLPKLYVLTAAFVSAQARLMHLKTTTLGRKVASWCSDVQVASCGVLSQECQCQLNGRTGTSSLSISLGRSGPTDYKIIACRLQSNIPAVVLLFFFYFFKLIPNFQTKAWFIKISLEPCDNVCAVGKARLKN